LLGRNSGLSDSFRPQRDAAYELSGTANGGAG
jgi:hypothetical protein